MGKRKFNWQPTGDHHGDHQWEIFEDPDHVVWGWTNSHLSARQIVDALEYKYDKRRDMQPAWCDTCHGLGRCYLYCGLPPRLHVTDCPDCGGTGLGEEDE